MEFVSLLVDPETLSRFSSREVSLVEILYYNAMESIFHQQSIPLIVIVFQSPKYLWTIAAHCHLDPRVSRGSWNISTLSAKVKVLSVGAKH